MTARAPSTDAVTHARQVCACPVCLDTSWDWQCDNRDQIAVALQQAAEQEREACAQLADSERAATINPAVRIAGNIRRRA